jgi:hypothetical protein
MFQLQLHAYCGGKDGACQENPPEAVDILTHKDKIARALWKRRSYNAPEGRDSLNMRMRLLFQRTAEKAPMVKRLAGSSTLKMFYVTSGSAERVLRAVVLFEDFERHGMRLKKYSGSGTIIVEEYIQREGYQIAGDAFLSMAKLVFAGLMKHI